MQKKYSNKIGIYRITSPSGRIYIGQSVNLRDRMLHYQTLNCKGQIRLYNSFLKYGWINHTFEVLEECLEQELNGRERFYQDMFDVLSKSGLNCKLTKTSDRSGKLSQETIQKRVDTFKRNGSKVSEEARANQSKARTGKHPRGRPIIDIETGIIYKSTVIAALSLGIKKHIISDKLLGRVKNNTSLRYYDEYKNMAYAEEVFNK